MDEVTKNFLEQKFNRHSELLPEHMVGAMHRYLFDRIPPGSFLTCVLSNDLRGAFGAADLVNRSRLVDIVEFCRRALPSISWGSSEQVNKWLANNELA
jgi:hypothetical protein